MLPLPGEELMSVFEDLLLTARGILVFSGSFSILSDG